MEKFQELPNELLFIANKNSIANIPHPLEKGWIAPLVDFYKTGKQTQKEVYINYYYSDKIAG